MSLLGLDLRSDSLDKRMRKLLNKALLVLYEKDMIEGSEANDNIKEMIEQRDSMLVPDGHPLLELLRKQDYNIIKNGENYNREGIFTCQDSGDGDENPWFHCPACSRGLGISLCVNFVCYDVCAYCQIRMTMGDFRLVSAEDYSDQIPKDYSREPLEYFPGRYYKDDSDLWICYPI